MMVLMFSTAGVPPLVGFWRSCGSFRCCGNPPPVAGGHRGRHLGGGAFYYLRVIKLMYFDEPAPHLPPAQAAAGVRLALD